MAASTVSGNPNIAVAMGTNGGVFDVNGYSNVIAVNIADGSGNGSGSLTVTNSTGTPGSLTLSGTNTFSSLTINNANTTVYITGSNSAGLTTGPLYLGAGTLNIGAGLMIRNASVIFGYGNIAGSGTLVGSSYTVTNSGSATITSTLGGSGTFTQSGTGTTTLAGINSYTGGTLVTNGTLKVSNTSALGSAPSLTVTNAGVFDLAGIPLTPSLLSGNGILSNSGSLTTLTLGVANSSGTFQGSVRGAVTLAKIGTGIQILSGSNNFLGGTSLTNGTLGIANAYALGTGGIGITNATLNVSYLPNGTVSLRDKNISLNNATIVIASSNNPTFLSNVGTLTIAGSGNLITNTSSIKNQGTNNLIVFSSLSGSGPISYVASDFGSGTATLNGSTATVGRTTYSLATNATFLQLIVSGGAWNINWTGAANADWNTNTSTTNWASNGVSTYFVTADNVAFTNLATATDINVMAGGVIAGAVGISNNTGTITFSGGSITANTGLTITGNTVAFNSPLTITTGGVNLTGATLSNNSITTINAGGLNLGSGTVSGAGTITADAFNSVGGVISASLAGGGAFTQNGAGTTTLTASNSYTGGTVVNSGMLVLSNTYALGAITGSLNVAGGTLNIGNNQIMSGAFTLGNGTITGASGSSLNATSYNATNTGGALVNVTLAGTGAFTQNGAGITALAVSNSYTGGTILNGGTLAIANNAAFGTGPLSVNANATISALTNVTISNSSIINSGATETFTGGAAGGQMTITNSGTNSVISGGGSLQVTNGTLFLYGSNTYSGGTTVNGGSLYAKRSYYYAATTNYIDNGNGTFSSNVISTGITNPVIAIGSGAVLVTNGGSVDLGGYAFTNSIVNTLQIATNITTNSGVVTTNITTNVVTVTTVTTNTFTNTFSLGGGTITNGTININNSSNTLINGTVAANLVGNIGLFLTTGSGTLVLSGTNTYSGGTTIGVLNTLLASKQVSLNMDNYIVTVSGGVLNLGGGGFNVGQNNGALNLTSRGIITNGSLYFNSFFQPSDGFVYANIKSGGVIKSGAGTVTLAGNNTFTNLVYVQQGTLVVTSIQSNGIQSSVGTTSPITLGYQQTDGTLIYSGSGSTNDRTFTIGSYLNPTNPVNFPDITIAYSGGGVLLNNGTGPMINTALTLIVPTSALWSSNSSTNNLITSRNLSLGGTNFPDTNEVQGIIRDNFIVPTNGNSGGTANLNLIKNGPNIWKLSGSNTFSGSLQITNGTLMVGNSTALGFGGFQPINTAASTATVFGGGTLDLNGTPDVNKVVVMSGGALVNNNSNASLGNGVAGMTVTDGGYYAIAPNYNSLTNVTVSITQTNGTGIGAGAVPQIGLMPGLILSAKGGTNFSIGDYVYLQGGGGGGATAYVSGVNSGIGTGSTNTVTEITIINPGQGYNLTNGPTNFVKITGNGGVINSGSGGTITNATRILPPAEQLYYTNIVSGIIMTNAGRGYTGGTAGFAISVTPSNDVYPYTNAVIGAVTLSSVILTNSSSMGGEGNMLINAAVSGSASALLTKVGGGILTLGASNSYSGGTLVSGGTLALGNSNALGTGAVTVASGAALSTVPLLNGAATLGGASLTLNGNSTLTTASQSVLFTNIGTFTIKGGSNLIYNTADFTRQSNTYTLISATSIPSTASTNLGITGAFWNGLTAWLNSNAVTIDRNTYQLTNTGTQIQLIVGGNVFDLLWTGAVNNNWDTNATNANWLVSGTTSPPISFVTGDNVTFANLYRQTITNDAVNSQGSNVLVSGMITITNSTRLTFSGGMITAAGMAINNGRNQTVVINNPLLIETNGLSLNGGSLTMMGASTITGGVVITNNSSLILSNTVPMKLLGAGLTLRSGTISGNGGINALSYDTLSGTISVRLSGVGSLTQEGGGTTILTTNNSYSGGTLITTNGTLVASNSFSLGTGSLTMQGVGNAPATLVVTNTGTNLFLGGDINLNGGTVIRLPGGSSPIVSKGYLVISDIDTNLISLASFNGNGTNKLIIASNGLTTNIGSTNGLSQLDTNKLVLTNSEFGVLRYGQSNTLNGATYIFTNSPDNTALELRTVNLTIQTWGSDNSISAIPQQASLGGVKAISVNPLSGANSDATFVAALNGNGAVVVWGGSTITNKINVSAVSNSISSGVSAIAAGYNQMLALKAGKVYAWGINGGGGATNVPTAAGSGITAISAGYYGCLALSTNGTVVAWGYKYAPGQPWAAASGLHLPTRVSDQYRSVDTTINIKVKQGTKVIGMSDGLYQAAFLFQDGTVQVLGDRFDGTLGDPNFETVWIGGVQTQTAVRDLKNIVAVSEGGNFSLALQKDGSIVGWGIDYGQLSGMTNNSGYKSISAGGQTGLALKNDGTVVAWGNNADNTTPNPPPDSVLNTTNTAVEAGYLYYMVSSQGVDDCQSSGGGQINGGGGGTGAPGSRIAPAPRSGPAPLTAPNQPSTSSGSAGGRSAPAPRAAPAGR
jgi:autotransporter-associated beta strand protein